MTTGKQLLTIAEMKNKGFSTFFGQYMETLSFTQLTISSHECSPSLWFCFLFGSPTLLRRKIENLIKRPGVPDPDAPEDAESTRWWASVGGSYTDKERMSISTTSKASVVSTSGTVAGLLGDFRETPSSQLALGNGSGSETPSTATSSGPSLSALVNVMNGEGRGNGNARAKGKAKAKARVINNAPKTPAEQRDDLRILAKPGFFH